MRVSNLATGLTLICLTAACVSRETVDVTSVAQPPWTIVDIRTDHDLPVVEISAGPTRLRLIVDTGAGATIWLAPEAAVKAGAAYTGGSSASSDAYGNRIDARDFTLHACRLGEIELRDVHGREYFTRQPGGPQVDGILGLGVLRHFRVIFDWPAGRMALATRAELPTEYAGIAWTDVAMDPSRAGISTDVRVDGVDLQMVWDTGASSCVLKPERLKKPTLSRRGRIDFAYAKLVTVAGVHTPGVEFAILDLYDPPGDGLVGHNFFMRHRVLLDLRTRRLALG